MHEIPERVHFIGFGGAGMSGLARILLDLGHTVSGSDLAKTPVIGRLESLGATGYKGHAAENLGDAELVVVSTAIKGDNPELTKAREMGTPVVHRGELLAMLMKRQRGIAVAGAHGKTTTTSMLALVLEKNNLDPTIIIGGELNDIGGNAKLGRGKFLVAEADESDGSFLKLFPNVVFITNVEDDHLDYYGSVEKIKEAFCTFINKVPPEGMAVACLDDPGVREVLKNYSGPLLTYAIRSDSANYTMTDIKYNGEYFTGQVKFMGQRLGLLELQVPGQHNLLNALGVVAAAHWAGVDFEGTASALKEFKGAGRRFQLMGEVNGIRVIDDYAHHPTEIKATLSAARQVARGRVICIFQPHRYSRTAQLYRRFGVAFGDADILVLDQIYPAGEKPIEGVSAGLIKSAVEQTGQEVKYFAGQEEIVSYVAENAKPGDMIITMGAGNIWSAGVDLVKRLSPGGS